MDLAGPKKERNETRGRYITHEERERGGKNAKSLGMFDRDGMNAPQKPGKKSGSRALM